MLYHSIVWYFRVNGHLLILGNQQDMERKQVSATKPQSFSDDLASVYETVNAYRNRVNCEYEQAGKEQT